MGSVIRDFEDVRKHAKHWTQDDAQKALGHAERGFATLHNNIPDMEKAIEKAYGLIDELRKHIEWSIKNPAADAKSESREIERYANAILDELKNIRTRAGRI